MTFKRSELYMMHLIGFVLCGATEMFMCIALARLFWVMPTSTIVIMIPMIALIGWVTSVAFSGVVLYRKPGPETDIPLDTRHRFLRLL
jgi:hypothetical protein